MESRKVYLLVLVHAHQIKPIVLLRSRLVEFDFAIAECAIQSFIADIAHAVKRKLCPALLQQHRLDGNVI